MNAAYIAVGCLCILLGANGLHTGEHHLVYWNLIIIGLLFFVYKPHHLLGGTPPEPDDSHQHDHSKNTRTHRQ